MDVGSSGTIFPFCKWRKGSIGFCGFPYASLLARDLPWSWKEAFDSIIRLQLNFTCYLGRIGSNKSNSTHVFYGIFVIILECWKETVPYERECRAGIFTIVFVRMLVETFAIYSTGLGGHS